MKKILSLIAALLIIGIVDGRVPAIGDSVFCEVEDVFYLGKITNMNDRFLCLNATTIIVKSGHINSERTGDVCLGWGLVHIRWDD